MGSVHRALAHPLRVRILELARQHDEVSPVDLTAELGAPLGVVSYHVRALAQAGLLELCGRSFHRGAVKHHYRVTERVGMTLCARMTPAEARAVADRIRSIFDALAGEGDEEVTVVLHHASGANAG
jgi:DNA-binding transcriptional ArsR family regulator